MSTGGGGKKGQASSSAFNKTMYFAWREGGGWTSSYYAAVGDPENEIFLMTCHDVYFSGRPKLRIFYGVVYIIWGGYTNLYIIKMDLEGEILSKEIIPNYYDKDVNERSFGWPCNMDFVVTRDLEIHIVWDSCWLTELSSIYTLAINDSYNDMNPAHIIRECLTNPHWGMGYPVEELDDDSFRAAADTLFSERFGLSLLWDKCGEIESFILDVLSHIEAVLYVDITTGLFKLKLIRKDYNVNQLRTIGPADVVEMKEYARKTQAELSNVVVVNYFDAPNNTTSSITMHNYPLINIMGQEARQEFNFMGISNSELANKVAARELHNVSVELANGTLVGNRRCSRFQIGDVFKLNWPAYGIENEVMRIIHVDYGTLEKGNVTIQFMQDIGGLGESTYGEPIRRETKDERLAAGGATAPKEEERFLFEVPYYFAHQYEELFADNVDTVGFVGYAVINSSNNNVTCNFYSGTSTDSMSNKGSRTFTPSAVINQSIPKQEENTILDVSNWTNRSSAKTNTLAVINDEWVAVNSISNTQVEIIRGVLDTVPVEHPSGSRIWFIGSGLHVDITEYAAGDTVFARAQSLSFDSSAYSTIDEITLDHRYIRPYPPGRFRIKEEYLLSHIIEDLGLISWAHRDRTQQTAHFVSQSEGNIGPEEGTTYTINIYGEDNILLRTIVGFEGNNYTYTREMEKEDSMLVYEAQFDTEVSITNFGARYE